MDAKLERQLHDLAHDLVGGRSEDEPLVPAGPVPVDWAEPLRPEAQLIHMTPEQFLGWIASLRQPAPLEGCPPDEAYPRCPDCPGCEGGRR